MTIEEYKNTSGAHTIIINNARYQENFLNAIEKIIKAFLGDKEVFFGFCRTDGINLTLEEQRKLKYEMLLLILLLAMGFAAVSTSLIINGTGVFGTNESDFEVIFTKSVINAPGYFNIL